MGERVLEKLVRETTVEIKNAEGLHMRPAMQFVDTASRFNSDIIVSNGQTDADGKSIMQMSMLAATCGTRLHLRAEGSGCGPGARGVARAGGGADVRGAAALRRRVTKFKG